jgi:hypothetical protein
MCRGLGSLSDLSPPPRPPPAKTLQRVCLLDGEGPRGRNGGAGKDETYKFNGLLQSSNRKILRNTRQGVVLVSTYRSSVTSYLSITPLSLRENLYKLLLCSRDVKQDPGESRKVGM